MSGWNTSVIVWSMIASAGIGASPAPAQAQATPQAAAAQSVAAAETPQQHPGWLQLSADWIQARFGSGIAKDGFYPEFGGMPPDSGIAAGPGYRHRFMDRRAVISASGVYSTSRGSFGQATLELPDLMARHLSAGVQVKRQDFTRISYFGVGPSSAKGNRTNYGLHNTDYVAFVSVKPKHQLTIGGHVGFSRQVDVARPRAANHPPTQDLFTEATAPGLTASPAFLHSDAYIDLDTRDHPSRPTSGGDYRATFLNDHDRDFGLYSFRRFEAEGSQFMSVHEGSVIVVRGRVVASGTPSGNTVPFYMLPALGGSRSLRGYEDYRFVDRNLLVLNAEYRWTVLGALDTALFYDAGQIAPQFGDLGLNNLRTSYGVGFRYHSDQKTFVRFDIGRSQAGTRFLIGVGEVFGPGHGAITIPYVP